LPRLVDDFAAIRTRLQELRGGRPVKVLMHEDIDETTERYPQHVMDATIRLLNELARRDLGPGKVDRRSGVAGADRAPALAAGANAAPRRQTGAVGKLRFVLAVRPLGTVALRWRNAVPQPSLLDIDSGC
jgi:hypothetical protein